MAGARTGRNSRQSDVSKRARRCQSARKSPSSLSGHASFVRLDGLDGLLLTPVDAQVVDHVAHAGDAFGNVFGQPLRAPVVNEAFEHDVAIHHVDFDLRGVNVAVVCEAVVDLFAYALVRAAITARPAAREPPALCAARGLPAAFVIRL